ncbi:MAG: hypothetical protein IJX92_06885 [Clostridia bacterium]|nr:hypothetical protein [Clostridia bacterium]
MKNTKISRVIAMVLAMVLVVCSAAMVYASATETAPAGEVTDKIQVVSKNANYQARTELMYAVTVDTEALLMDRNDTVYMLFWNSEQTGEDAYTFGTANYRVYSKDTEEVGHYGECYVFSSDGINACDISKPLYARPAVKYIDIVDGNIEVRYVYGELIEYSIADYAEEMLAKSDITEAQRNLYTDLLTYGAEARKLADRLLGN